jgi:hypothetical protein
MSSLIRVLLAFSLGVGVGVGCTLKERRPNPKGGNSSSDVRTQLPVPTDDTTNKTDDSTTSPADLSRLDDDGAPIPKDPSDSEDAVAPSPSPSPSNLEPLGGNDVQHIIVPANAPRPLLLPDPAIEHDPRDAEQEAAHADSERVEGDHAAAESAGHAAKAQVQPEFPNTGSPELMYIEGLTVEGSQPQARLYTHDEAVAKAAEISNAGVDYNKFVGFHAFLLSIDDRALHDRAAVDKALELGRGGYDLDKIRPAYEFLNEISDASSGQKVLVPAQALDQAVQLSQNAYFDMDALRTKYTEVAKDRPAGAALQQAIADLGLNASR